MTNLTKIQDEWVAGGEKKKVLKRCEWINSPEKLFHAGDCTFLFMLL